MTSAFTTRHFAVSFALVVSDLHVQGTCFYLLLLCGAVIHWFYFEWLNSWLLQMFDDRLWPVSFTVWCQSSHTDCVRCIKYKRRVFDRISEPLKKRLEIRGVGQGLLGTYNVKGTHSFLVDCETSGGSGPVKSSHVGFLACYPS